jgi:ABC-type arginine transport system permease subunit
MFVTLLIVVFVVAFVMSTVVAVLFDKPIRQLLNRIVPDDLTNAWTRYLKLAIYVVGISGGVRVWSLERYISKRTATDEILQLTRDRWIVEIYQTVIGTLQSIVWMLLVFFVFALIAFVIVRALELRRERLTEQDQKA